MASSVAWDRARLPHSPNFISVLAISRWLQREARLLALGFLLMLSGICSALEPQRPPSSTPEPVSGSAGKAPAGTATPHPILPATAEKYRSELDWSDGGAAPLSFTRIYRSNWAFDSARAGSGLGRVWSHSHHFSLSASPAASPSAVTITLPEGYVRSFALAAGSSAWRATNNADSLSRTTAGGWSWRRADDDSMLTFDDAGKLQTQVARNGWVTSYAYSAGQLASVTNPFGRVLAFTYAGDKLTGVTTPDGRVIGYGFDSVGRLASVTYPDGQRRAFVYENPSFAQALTGIVDETGTRWGSFTYDAQGRAVVSELAGGVDRYQVSYPAADTASITDPLGITRSYRYAVANGKLAVTAGSLPSGRGEADASARVLDPNGLITGETDFKGVRADTTWDAARRLPLAVTAATGTPEARTTTTQWHPGWALPVLVTEPGRSTAYTYDAQGKLLARTVTHTDTSPQKVQIWAWSYTPQGLVASAAEPNGAVTRYTHDSRGNVVKVINALGHETLYAWDDANRLVGKTDPNGLVSSYTWDTRDRLLSRTVGGQQTTAFTYTPFGAVETVSLPTGLRLSYTYDTAQRLTGWRNNRFESGSFTLDAMGNRVAEQVKNAGGAVAWSTARSINSLNRPASQTEGSNQTRTLGYDPNGELVSQANGLNQSTRWGLDSLRRVAAITDAANATATLAYNALDGVTQASDFKGVATRYSRDAQGNAMSETSADIGSRSTEFDALGLPRRIVDALGQATQISRDALGRPTLLGFADGKATVLSYDGAAAGKGYLSSFTDRSGTTSYERDAFGRVTLKSQRLANGDLRRVRYAYTAAGLLETITYPSGARLKHLHDATGRIVQLHWNELPLVTDIAWNPLGQPVSWRWQFADDSEGATLAAFRGYDSAGRLTQTEFSSYAFDAAGRIVSLTQNLYKPADADPASSDVASESVRWEVAYDALGRITRFESSNPAYGSASFGYDPNGNRTASTHMRAGQNTSRTYTLSANRMSGFAQTAGAAATSVVYGHNANGDLVSDGLRTYTYNAEARLGAVTTGTGEAAPTTRYAHNALGQRVFKTEPLYAPVQETNAGSFDAFLGFIAQLWNPAAGAERLGFAFVYDEQSSLLGDYGMGGANSSGLTEYMYLPTAGGPMPIMALVGGRKYAVHADHLNTPRRMTRGNGRVVWQWAYSAFGDEEPTTAAKRFTSQYTTPTSGTTNMAPVALNLGYWGMYRDQESGLAQNRYRYYDARTGRYIQPDPIGLDGGPNRFPYAELNPLMFTDPFGLQSDRRPNRPGWPDWIQPTQPNPYCATAECAASLLPAPSERRSQSEIDQSLCETICSVVAPDNVLPGGIGFKKLGRWAAEKAGAQTICKLICKDKNACPA